MEGLDLSRDVSLYIHIPFCTTKCAYCAFYSLPESACKEGEKALFINILSKQLDALVESIRKPFYTIFIGGGNPAMLGFNALYELLRTATRYGKPKECTIEINPECVSLEMVKLFDFVNRVSVGIQSFDDEALAILGRNAKSEDNERALGMLSAFRTLHGIQLNGDLITCIPSADPLGTSIKDIKRLASFNPDHISLYALTFEEGTRLTEKYSPLEDEKQEEILKGCWKTLKELKYEQYEVSNFARKGAYSKHNLVYWHLGQYIGLGPTAESSVGYKKLISSREKDTLAEYLKDPSFDAYALTPDEAMEEYLLTNLRTKWGIGKNEFKNRFGLSFDEKFSDFLSDLDEGTYIDDNLHFAITEEGFMVLDSIILKLAMAI